MRSLYIRRVTHDGKRWRAICLCATFLVATSAAFGGTATFAGADNDTDARLQGAWVSYEPDGIANGFDCSPDNEHCGPEALNSPTTNLTLLCGTRSAEALGTVTLVLAGPNDGYSQWYGNWAEVEFKKSGGTQAFKIGLGPPFTWGSSQAAYIGFGNQGNERPHWHIQDLSTEPVGIRLASDGANLTLSWSPDGVEWNALQSWAINNLPVVGNITGQPLSAEILETGHCTTISRFVWEADTVLCINTSCSGGEGEGEGEPEPEHEQTCEEVQLSVFETNVVDYVGIMTGVAYGDWPDTDLDHNGIPDRFEYMLLAYAMCQNPAVAAAYQANYDTMAPLWTGDWASIAVMHAAWGTISQSMIDALKADAWGGDGLVPYTEGKAENEPLSAEGDFDGDGYKNLEEYQYIAAHGGSPADYGYAASGGIAGPGTPVAGVAGLCLLAGAFAVGGALRFRSKK